MRLTHLRLLQWNQTQQSYKNSLGNVRHSGVKELCGSSDFLVIGQDCADFSACLVYFTHSIHKGHPSSASSNLKTLEYVDLHWKTNNVMQC
mmetsp:Transcript_4480/g.6840  ORF Transcript_4480/g.6840 Transcript_4480/m.6840 type:complete len:91 (+) Transcript_4480:624-896(+)